MVDYIYWKQSIKEILKCYWDKEYQYNQWFVCSTEAVEPDDLYYQLIEDNVFDQFLEDKNIDLTPEQKRLGFFLKSKIDEYFNQFNAWPKKERVYFDPKWEVIRRAAKEFYDALGQEV